MGLSISIALGFWIIDAILDLHYKNVAETFFQSLFTDEPLHDFYTRIFVVIIMVIYGAIISRYIGKMTSIENHYNNLLNRINDAIFILDLGNTNTSRYTIKEINQSACAMLGYGCNELLHISFSDLIISKGASEIAFLSEALREDKHIVFEANLRRKDGGNLIAEISVSSCNVSGNPGALLIARDITMKKRNQDALLESERQLGILASQLLNAQEAERRRISVGLHDELGQALMHLKFKVGSFIKSQRGFLTSPNAGQGLLSSVDEIIEYVRRFSRELSPSVLEELGLASSIYYLAEGFCNHYQMNYSVDVDEIDHIFSFEAQLSIFRIIQECLTNVARHSQATMVTVAAKRRGDDPVSFTVKDDGKGFDVKQLGLLNGARQGIGIAAMKQRVLMAKGTFELSSSEGAGTTVTFTIPIVQGA